MGCALSSEDRLSIPRVGRARWRRGWRSLYRVPAWVVLLEGLSCGCGIEQFPALRPKEMSNKRMSKTQKSVNRIYGGHLDHKVERCS